jgi:outer membrane protein OmpA-like peptidoglycan-associated protein
LIGQRISLSLLIVAASASFAGCRSHLDNIADERVQPSIGYLDGKYKVCRENCPVPTPKELDDSVPAETLVYEFLRKTVPIPPQPVVRQAPLPQPVAEVIDTPIEPPIAIPTFDIYFDFGMSKPNKEGKKELRRFVNSVEQRETTQIELVGKTDDIGTKNFNRKLAFKRALYVETWLKAHGVNAQITISAKEECCRVAPYDKAESSLKEKRKVVIHNTGTSK